MSIWVSNGPKFGHRVLYPTSYKTTVFLRNPFLIATPFARRQCTLRGKRTRDSSSGWAASSPSVRLITAPAITHNANSSVGINFIVLSFHIYFLTTLEWVPHNMCMAWAASFVTKKKLPSNLLLPTQAGLYPVNLSGVLHHFNDHGSHNWTVHSSRQGCSCQPHQA